MRQTRCWVAEQRHLLRVTSGAVAGISRSLMRVHHEQDAPLLWDKDESQAQGDDAAKNHSSCNSSEGVISIFILALLSVPRCPRAFAQAHPGILITSLLLLLKGSQGTLLFWAQFCKKKKKKSGNSKM